MLWPYAGGCREDNRPQCADRPRLPPPLPLSLSPVGPQTSFCKSHQLQLTARAGPKPPFLLRHLPLTSTSHCPSLCSQPTPKTCFPRCLAEAWFVQLHCLIPETSYSLWWIMNILFISFTQVKAVIWQKSLSEHVFICVYVKGMTLRSVWSV